MLGLGFKTDGAIPAEALVSTWVEGSILRLVHANDACISIQLTLIYVKYFSDDGTASGSLPLRIGCQGDRLSYILTWWHIVNTNDIVSLIILCWPWSWGPLLDVSGSSIVARLFSGHILRIKLEDQAQREDAHDKQEE